jgi:hypothetical protein
MKKPLKQREMKDLKQPFRITIEHYNQKVSVEVDHSDVSLSEVADLLEQVLKGAGFLEESVTKMINQEF